MLAEILEGEVVEIVCGGVSDVGRVRTNNEDSYQILEFAEPICPFRWHGG